VQGPALLHTIKEILEKKMKKTYFSPETEVVLLNLNQSVLLTTSSISDEVDPGDGPTPTTDTPLPGNEDGEW